MTRSLILMMALCCVAQAAQPLAVPAVGVLDGSGTTTATPYRNTPLEEVLRISAKGYLTVDGRPVKLDEKQRAALRRYMEQKR